MALITAGQDGCLQPLPLGRAVVASGVPPEEALLLRVSTKAWFHACTLLLMLLSPLAP